LGYRGPDGTLHFHDWSLLLAALGNRFDRLKTPLEFRRFIKKSGLKKALAKV